MRPSDGIAESRAELLQLLRQRGLRRGNFTLASGRQSDYYIDGKQVTLESRGAYLCARLIRDRCAQLGAAAIGGLTIGADPLVAAVLALAGAQGQEMQGFLVRKMGKEHGTKSVVEGPALTPEEKVVLVDDTTTTGASYVTAAEAIAGSGGVVVECICVVDRQEGASQALAERGLALYSLFTRDELLG